MWLVRHGESEGNVANARARRDGALRLDITVNDPNIELSPTGETQANALGSWLGELPAERQPTVVVVSPYVRAQQTATLALAAAGLTSLAQHRDERLRDREQGVLDRLTAAGLRERYPEEADRRDYLGKFWFRPMGGESWADVALRVRSALRDIRMDLSEERVLIVSHDAPILLCRYVLERLSEAEVTALSGQVQNCSVTRYERGDHGLELAEFSDTSALERDTAAPVTAHD